MIDVILLVLVMLKNFGQNCIPLMTRWFGTLDGIDRLQAIFVAVFFERGNLHFRIFPFEPL
jgi:hypothetical protein